MDSPDLNHMNLAQLREFVFENSKGAAVVCPCCDKKIRLFRRPLNRGMCIALIYIVDRFLATREPIDMRPDPANPIPRIVARSHGDYNKLVHWGLISLEFRDAGKDRAKVGFVSPTQLGLDFVDEKVGVPGHIFISAGVLRGFDDTSTIWFSAAMGVDFNFEELMASFDSKVTSPERSAGGDFEEEEDEK